MLICLWSLSAALLLLGLHPFLTYPLSLRVLRLFFRKQVRLPSSATRATQCTLCFCARNEEAVIEEKIENLLRIKQHLAQRGFDLRILVYADACTDDTVPILQRYAPQIGLVVGRQRAGKSAGMNALMQLVETELVVFSDANVLFDEQTIPNLLRPLADDEVGCVVGQLVYTNRGESSTAMISGLYWRMEEGLKQLESDTGSVMGADGSIFAIRRRLFREVPADTIDDMFTSLSILCDGYRIVRAGDALAYERAATSSPDEYRRRVRITCRAWNCQRLLLPRLRRLSPLNQYKYVSHKVNRWLAAYMWAASLLCAGAAMVIAGGGPAAAGAAGAGAVFGVLLALPPGRPVRELILAFSGTGLGIWHSCRGERFQTWEPVASVRVSETSQTPLSKKGCAA